MTGAKSSKKKNGFGLVLVLGVTAVLAVFTAAIGAQASYNLQTVQRQGDTDLAYYGAYTGIQLSMALLNQPPPYVYYSDDGEGPGSWLEHNRRVALNFSNGVKAGAKVFHNIEGFTGATLTADDGTEIPLNHFYIMAVGELPKGPDEAGVRFEASTMGATIAPVFPTMPHALFGSEEVVVEREALIRHIDSTGDPMDLTPDPGPNLGPEASIATNEDKADAITVVNTAEIDGNIFFAPGTDLSEFSFTDETTGDPVPPAAGLVMPGGSSLPLYGMTNLPNHSSTVEFPLTGRITTLPLIKQLDTVEAPDPEVRIPLDQTISTTKILDPGGIYYVDGDLTITSSGNLTLPVDGEDATVFVNGNISIVGGGSPVNGDRAPRRLKLFSLPTAGSTFTLGGTTPRTANLLVAGNNLDVTIATESLLRGAALGRSVVVQERAQVHYDVALRDPRILASVYGYQVVGFAASTGATIRPGDLAPPPVYPPEPDPGLPDPPPPPPPGGGGCGCGCGGGSQEFMMKV